MCLYAPPADVFRSPQREALRHPSKQTLGGSEKRLTVLSGLLNERVNAAFAVVPLGGHRGDVVPAHGFDDVHHGLGLVGVRGHHPGEEVVAGVIAQFRSCGGVAHLRDLRERRREAQLLCVSDEHLRFLAASRTNA